MTQDHIFKDHNGKQYYFLVGKNNEGQKSRDPKIGFYISETDLAESTIDDTIKTQIRSGTYTQCQRLLTTKMLKTSVFIKRTPHNTADDISEFLGGQIFNFLEPEYASKISLIKNNNPYIVSEINKGYKGDFFKECGYDSRPKMIGTRENITSKLSNTFFDKNGEEKYIGFDKIAPISLLIGDNDIHTGNIVVIEKDGKQYLSRIDFGRAFLNTADKVNPAAIISPIQKVQGHIELVPTNHFREYHKKLRHSKKFVESILDISDKDLTSKITNAFSTLKKHYSQQELSAWASRAMPDKFVANKIHNIEQIQQAIVI